MPQETENKSSPQSIAPLNSFADGINGVFFCGEDGFEAGAAEEVKAAFDGYNTIILIEFTLHIIRKGLSRRDSPFLYY